jgi:hypothetical protein
MRGAEGDDGWWFRQLSDAAAASPARSPAGGIMTELERTRDDPILTTISRASRGGTPLLQLAERRGKAAIYGAPTGAGQAHRARRES